MRRSSHLSHLRNPRVAAYAIELRARMTDAEMKVWYHLRARRFLGWKFRRQVPIGDYVADFVCEEARVIVEIDGGQHDVRRERDERRSRWLTGQGYRVVRVWNNDVFGNIDGVLERITEALPSPCPLPREGEES